MEAQAIVLLRRPDRQLRESDFGSRTVTLAALSAGEVLVAARYLSIDPYQRGLLDEKPFVGMPVAVGGVMAGRGIGEVLESRDARFNPGDLVFGDLGWQSHSVQASSGLRAVVPGRHPATWQLGVLGMPGITAWIALHTIAMAQAGEHVVVSSAAGTVGSAAGQIAKASGCRVVGVAGGARKAALVRSELGFDDAVDYRATPDLAKAIGEMAPGGVDVYFDNVGGPMLDAMLSTMKARGRIVICGAVSSYEGDPPPLRNHALISFRRLRLEGFSVRDHAGAHAAAAEALRRLADDGALKQVETISEGLATAPAALVGLLRGAMTGKVIVVCR